MIELAIWQIALIALATFCIGVVIRVYIAAGRNNDSW